MVDALVLEASTSVCGFESHLPHQKEKGAERCLFLLAPAAAGTSASLYVWQEPAVPPHTPLPFCDTIQFVIETDRPSHRLPQDSPSRTHAAERHTKTIHSSLFTCPAPAFPSHFPGAPESRPPQGRRISSPAAIRDCKTPFPPHGPACRAQACSEPMPQSGTPKLFTLLYSLFTRPALLLFPSGTDSKTKIYFVFFT